LLERLPALRNDTEGVLDLIVHELSLRERAGEAPKVAEYLARFPSLAGLLEPQLQLRELVRTSESTPKIDGGQSLLGVARASDQGAISAPPGYEIEVEVGRGGMGVVYRARQLALNRRVALKVVLAGSHADPARLARVHVEAQAVARLQHPNIVQIFEVSEHGGCPFLALEYVEGGNLATVCAGRPHAPRWVAELVETLARAVHEVHRMGIVHRDLKPTNILLTTSGTPKVADFGLAKILEGESARTDSSIVIGTPSYMAPEQASGESDRARPATDVYALGAILYELLTGRPPYKAGTPLETLLQVISADVVPPRRLVMSIPRDLEIICLKCLEKEPAQRYASAVALADDLRRFLADRPILARPRGRLEHAGRWCRRNPALAIASGLATAGLFGISILSSLYAVSAAQNEKRLSRSATSLREALRSSEEHRRANELQIAENYLDRARALADQGNGVAALLFLTRTLEIVSANDAGFERAIRAHIGSLSGGLHRPSLMLDPASQIGAVALSTDGMTVACGRFDGKILLWGTRGGERASELLGHRARIRALAFSADGRTLISGSDDGTARLWDMAARGQIGGAFHLGGEVRAVAISPDGSTALAGNVAGSARLFEVSTGKPIGEALSHHGMLRNGEFDLNGKTVLTYGGDACGRFWDSSNGRPLGPVLQHDLWIQTAAFSEDGRFVLTGGDDRTARLWERKSGKPVGEPLRHGDVVRAAVFSPAGDCFATASADATARIWDIATTHPIGLPLKHQQAVNGLAFSADGSILATGSDDQTARLWDVQSGEPIGVALQHSGQVWGVKFSPDGRLMSWGQDDPVRFWQVEKGESGCTRLPHRNPVTAVASSPGGNTIVTGTSDPVTFRGELQQWDLIKRQRIGPAIYQAEPILALTFSPDGKQFLSGIGNAGGPPFGYGQLWDAATGKPSGPPVRHPKAVTAVAFSPDGLKFVTASEDRTARLSKAWSGEEIRTFRHEDWLTAAAISPDGKLLLTGSEDRIARLWDLETAKAVGQPMRHQATVMAVAFSPDGKTALTGSLDHTAQLWDTTTCKPIGNPLRHNGWVAAVAFNADGRTILTASADNTVQLWDTNTRRPIGFPFRHEGRVLDATFGADGQTVLSGSADKTARIWTVPRAIEGELERIVLWTQVITGAELDENDLVRVLDATAWHDRRRRLDELGGPPVIR
jgi:WD40 repeat protein/serine/threonine protein kinase